MEKNTVSITGVLIQDPASKAYTAYFAEMPDVIAEGRNEEEATKNLFEAFQSVLDFRKEESHEEEEDGNIFTRSFNLALNI